MPIPWRRFYAAVIAAVSVALALLVLYSLRRVVAWLVVAVFFAVVLSPAVNRVERALRLRRGLAVALVVGSATVIVIALITVIVVPLVHHAQDFAANFSDYVDEARAGRGPLGGIVQRFNLDRWISEHQQDIQNATNQLGAASVDLLRSAGNFLIASLTIFVLTVLILIEGPRLIDSGVGLVGPKHRDRLRRVGSDCGHAVSGYVLGNVIISVIAGAASYACLKIARVPFAEVLALWVGFADLIPLVGATIGAAPAVIVAFLQSVPAGIAVLVFFIVYQQFENHVLQVTIMSRTVQLNPLAVLISVLIGVELFGFLGALLAIPAGGVVQIVVRELWSMRPSARLAAEASGDECATAPDVVPSPLEIGD